jgi:hypothetical protein
MHLLVSHAHLYILTCLLFNPNFTITILTRHGKRKSIQFTIVVLRYKNDRCDKVVAFAYLIPQGVMHSYEIKGHKGKIISHEPNNGQLIHDGGTKTGTE